MSFTDLWRNSPIAALGVSLACVVIWAAWVAPDISGRQFAPSMLDADLNPRIRQWGQIERKQGKLFISNWSINGSFNYGPGYCKYDVCVGREDDAFDFSKLLKPASLIGEK